MAARWFRYGMVAMLLLAGGGIPPLAAQDDPEVAEEEPATLLAAAGAGNMARVRALLEAGAAVDAADEDGMTPLMAASMAGSIEVVEHLLERGADPARRDADGDDALTYAAFGRATDVARLLLQRGADPNHRGASGMSPLHRAAANGDTATLRLLFEHGGDAGSIGGNGSSVLHYATSSGVVAAVRLVADRGADLDVMNDQRVTPWMAAVVSFDSVMADTLAGRGSVHAETTRWGLESAVFGLMWARGLRSARALNALARADSLIPNLPVVTEGWAVVCETGTLVGEAAVVAAACDRAVRGDYSGAVADFRAVLASESDSTVRAERVAWIAALERGENPLSPGVLEGRRYPWLKGSAIRTARGLGYDLIALVPSMAEIPDSALLQQEGPGGTTAFLRTFASPVGSFAFAGARLSGLIFITMLAGGETEAERTVQQMAALDSVSLRDLFRQFAAQGDRGTLPLLRIHPVQVPDLAVPVALWDLRFAAGEDHGGGEGAPAPAGQQGLLGFLARGPTQRP